MCRLFSYNTNWYLVVGDHLKPYILNNLSVTDNQFHLEYTVYSRTFQLKIVFELHWIYKYKYFMVIAFNPIELIFLLSLAFYSILNAAMINE